MKNSKKRLILSIFLGLALLIACTPPGSSIPGDDSTPTPEPTIRPTPPPDSPYAEGIRFIDVDAREYYIKGNILVDKAWDESNVSFYKLYLGSSESTLDINIAQLPPANQNLDYPLSAIYLQPGIKYILVTTLNQAGIENNSADAIRAMPISDLVVQRVTDINPGAGSSNPQGLQEYNGRLYFKATDTDSLSDNKLICYDDADKSVTKTFNITNPTSGPGNINAPDYLNVFNNKLYFQAFTENEGVELWNCDSSNNTQLVANINPGGQSSIPKNFQVFQAPGDANPKLYFQATEYTVGSELYVCDVDDNVNLAADVNFGASNSSFPEYLTVYQDKLCFVGLTATGTKIYAYAGSAAAPATIKFAGASPRFLTVYNNKLYFQCLDPTPLNLGIEAWWYLNDASYSYLDINFGQGSSYPENFTVYNNYLYFTATNSAGNKDLYYYNDNDFMNIYKIDINPGSGSNPACLTENDYKLFFQANNGINGKELWVYDFYYEKPGEIDLLPGSTGSEPDNLEVYYGCLYFSADSGDGYGRELYQAYYMPL